MKTIILFSLISRLAAGPELPAELLRDLETAWPKNRTINLVFHGHSVPAGYHKTPEVRPFESYPHLVHLALKQKYPLAVINVVVTAIGGEDSIAGAARFERDVVSHRPDVVFIDYALNDRRKVPAQVEAAWLAMIHSARKHAIPVVLITPTGDAKADLTNPADPLCQRAVFSREVAGNEKLILADVFQAWQQEVAAGTPQIELLSQGNHPNLRGHALAAKAIVEAVFK